MSRSPVLSTALAVGLLISCLSAAATDQSAVALTLDETFAQALVRSEVVATQSELIRQAEERYQQADAAIYPTVSGFASYTWQDSGARELQPLAQVRRRDGQNPGTISAEAFMSMLRRDVETRVIF